IVMDPERNGESQDNRSNVDQPHIQKKRKASRGQAVMLEMTKNWDGKVILVEYDKKFEDGGTSKVDKAASNIEFSIPQDMVDDSSAANGEVASQLQKFGKIIEKMMKSSQISIPLEKGVFEEEIAFNYFLKSDLLDVCNMKKLEVNSMTAYLRFSLIDPI
ncbi:hypothetical protein IFM89_016144, partial [Coptis chinensis]